MSSERRQSYRSRRDICIEFPVETSERNYRDTKYKDVTALNDYRQSLCCTVCRLKLVKSFQRRQIFLHPLFKVLLCFQCYKNYNSETEAIKGNNFCSLCANSRHVLMCSMCTCKSCLRCLKRNYSSKQIEEDQLLCLHCDRSRFWQLRAIAALVETKYLSKDEVGKTSPRRSRLGENNSRNQDVAKISEKILCSTPVSTRKRKVVFSDPEVSFVGSVSTSELGNEGKSPVDVEISIIETPSSLQRKEEDIVFLRSKKSRSNDRSCTNSFNSLSKVYKNIEEDLKITARSNIASKLKHLRNRTTSQRTETKINSNKKLEKPIIGPDHSLNSEKRTQFEGFIQDNVTELQDLLNFMSSFTNLCAESCLKSIGKLSDDNNTRTAESLNAQYEKIKKIIQCLRLSLHGSEIVLLTHEKKLNIIREKLS